MLGSCWATHSKRDPPAVNTVKILPASNITSGPRLTKSEGQGEVGDNYRERESFSRAVSDDCQQSELGYI